MINKSRRFKGLRYHAKSRMGRENTNIMKVTIVLGIYYLNYKLFRGEANLGII